jgi:hypothetical protein
MFNDKNAVIFGISLTPENLEIVPMGSLYDSLEYFMKIYETNKDVQLLFHLSIHYVGNREIFKRLNGKFDFLYEQLKKIIDGKYDIDDYSFFDNIHFIDIKELFWNNNLNKILTIDLMTPRLFKEIFARAKSEILIISELTSDSYFYRSKANKVTYYTEMPFCYCDVPYRIKFDFEKWKPISHFDNKLYVNYPKKNPLQEPKILIELNKFKKEILVKENQFLYDLHAHFNEYVYFQSDKWFDTHPKLFHESKFYNKPYHYFNWKNVKDGAYYRYKWSLDDNLKDLQLDNNDIIIKKMME